MKKTSFLPPRLLLLALPVLAAAFLFTGAKQPQGNPACSAMVTVTTTADSGAGSLRQALLDVCSGGTINFAPALNGQTIILASTLSITQSVTINGPGANLLTVSGNNLVQVLNVNPGNSGSVSLSGLTIAAGNAGGGGGISNQGGTLTVTNSTFSGNSAIGGGGIFNQGGTLTVTNSSFSGNSAPNGGGGIYNQSSGTLTVTNSTFSGNSGALGGGIYNGGTVTVTNSTFSGNSVTNGGQGGGIFNQNGTLTVTNSTFSGNSANSGVGGGIFNESSGTLNIGNTIVAGNTATAGFAPDVFGGVNSRGHNLIGNTSNSAGWNGTDFTGTTSMPLDPMLGPLQNNGGPTQTRALLSGSMAIDNGDNMLATNAGLTTDQRGYARVVNGTVDIGAFEVQPPATLGNYPATTIPLSTDTTVAPTAAPTNAARLSVATSTDFKGKLEINPTTGVVRVTDAHPAVPTAPGFYTITVSAFNLDGLPTSKSFTLTVTTPATCNPVTFAPAANIAAGINPASVAVGDFNGDRQQDLAVANLGTDDVSILLGNGAGGFSAASNFAAGTTPVSVAVGDFNGDGVQDLAVAGDQVGFAGSTVSILLGTGTGVFGPATNFAVGSNPNSVAVGDFNGDGKQDLAVANANSTNVSILLGNGDGTFSAANNFAAGSVPRSVAVGDFNGDGVQDLAVANVNSSNVSILLGNGAGGFTGPTNFAAGGRPFSVAVGDFNGDGKQDLAVANAFDNNVSILLGNGAGGFNAANNFAAGSAPRFVAVGDFNGDGLQDLAVANAISNNVSILLGNGDGTFSAAINFAVGSGPFSVAVGDFNGDGQQDLAVANFQSANVSILLRTCTTVTVCHKGGSSAQATLTFPVNSLELRRHLDHGDPMGACPMALTGREEN